MQHRVLVQVTERDVIAIETVERARVDRRGPMTVELASHDEAMSGDDRPLAGPSAGNASERFEGRFVLFERMKTDPRDRGIRRLQAHQYAGTRSAAQGGWER